MLRGGGIPFIENKTVSKFKVTKSQSLIASFLKSQVVKLASYSKINSFKVPNFQTFKDSKTSFRILGERIDPILQHFHFMLFERY